MLVISPDYVSGLEGIIIGKDGKNRIVVKLKDIPVDSRFPIILSLEEKDFIVNF